MTEINHRYLKDRQGEEFYPITHIDAVQGFDTGGTDASLSDMNDKINQANKSIDEFNNMMKEQKDLIDKQAKIIEEQSKSIKTTEQKIKDANNVLNDVAGDTGWIDYQVHPNNTKNYISTGSPCAIREVRVGNSSTKKAFAFRSIRINIGKIYHGQTIAQLPQGFTKDTVSFVLRSTGSKTPIEISIEKDNSVKAFTFGNESNLWAYGEYTWLV